MLDKEQYIGAAALFLIAITGWLFVALYPQSDPSFPEIEINRRDSLYAMQSVHRRDSLRALRDARWQSYKDSCYRVDSRRFALWAAERRQRYDSARLADSLWRDSVGWRYAQHIKKDTILDLNHCDTTELQYIRGIGSYKARRIMRYGQELGGYYSPNQLTDEALSDLHLDSLLHYFTADSTEVQCIDVNSSSADRLYRHPYLRYAQAKAIYNYRRKYVRLDSITQLENLQELEKSDINRIKFYLCFDN